MYNLTESAINYKNTNHFTSNCVFVFLCLTIVKIITKISYRDKTLISLFKDSCVSEIVQGLKTQGQ